jgi:DNA polymerase-4/DNA polymerase V
MKEERKQVWVLHIDGDAFFASVEQSRRPELWGKPVVVGEERGIATAMSYEAKKLGVERGTPIFKIKRDYKNVMVLSSHFELYNKYAQALANILKEQVDVLETYSIDECFATIFDTKNNLVKRISSLKNLVQKKLGITYSFGVSTTKVLAKVASKRNKPNGLCFLLDKESIEAALLDTKVDKIWGLGHATCRKLISYNINTAYEFVTKTMPQPLLDMLSINILETKDELLGKKRFLVTSVHEHKKSIQSTRSFIKRTGDKKTIQSELSKNLETAMAELYSSDLYTNRVVLFVKEYKDTSLKYNLKSKILSQEFILPSFTQNILSVSKCIDNFIEQTFDKKENGYTTTHRLFKSSGVILTNLKTRQEIPISLFVEEEVEMEKENRFNKLINGLRDKYGFGVVVLGSSLDSLSKRTQDRKDRDIKDNYIYGLPYKYLGEVKD